MCCVLNGANVAWLSMYIKHKHHSGNQLAAMQHAVRCTLQHSSLAVKHAVYVNTTHCNIQSLDSASET